jgi:hypothetical protein
MNISPSLLLGAQLLMPVSEQVPALNVAASCKAATAIAIADAQSYDACMKDETSAREQLAQTWQSFSLPERTNCIAEASIGGAASYVDLLVCLQMARDAAAAEKVQLKGARKK